MKWVAGYATNTALGLPGIHAVVVVNDPETGIPTAMLDGGPITAERTAAVSGGPAAFRAAPGAGGVGGDAPEIAMIGAGSRPVAPRRLRRPPAGCRAADLRPITGASGGPRRRGSLDPRHRLGGGQGTAREAVDGAHVVFTAASFGPADERQTMTNDWLRKDATVIPIDYATYCAARSREAALFVVDQREQYLAIATPATSTATRTRWRHSGRRSSRAPRGRRAASSSPTSAWASRTWSSRTPSCGRRRPQASARSCLADDRWDASGRSDRRRRGWRIVKAVTILLSLAICAIAVLGAVTTQRLAPDERVACGGGSRRRQPSSGTRTGSSRSRRTAGTTCSWHRATSTPRSGCGRWSCPAASGRAGSELFGKGQVDTDRYIRTLGWRIAAQRDLEAMSAESQKILEACRRRERLDPREQRPARRRSSSPASSRVPTTSGFELEPWTPLDTATWQKVQAWSLGGNVDRDLPAPVHDFESPRERTSCSLAMTRTPPSSRRRTSSATAPGRAGRRDRCRVG